MKLPDFFKRSALGLALLAGSNMAMAAECGDIQIAEWNWASGELMANVDKLILEEGFGCKVEMVPGATTTTFASMNEKGKPDLAGELWINAVREPLSKAFAEKTLHSINDGPITELGEGWWIPPATAAKHPELKTVMDVLERPDLFPDKEDPSKGAFIGCPSGWGCQLANINLFRAFEMEKKGWKLVDPGSAAGLDGSMTKAVERGTNWFGYYWSPTAMIGKHKMVKLPFGVPFAGKENWDGCIAKAEQECVAPKPSAWTESEVHTVVTKKFQENGGPDVMAYLNKRVFLGTTMNGMLVYMGDEQAGGEDAAFEFLSKHQDLWTQWVTEEVAAKVMKGLKIVAAPAEAAAAPVACGDVQIAEWNWASGELMANVDKIILEEGFGCKVELVPGATTTTFASMNEKGKPDLAGELWINAVREPLSKAFAEKTLHSVNDGPITQLGEGWWIPPATAEKHPELKTVMDVLERPDLFPDKEDPSKGAFIGCPAGWGCQLANINLFRAFDMEKKGWKLVDPGSAAGLDGSMTKAVERGTNWFGYYWSPTAMIGKHKMVKLPFGVPFAGKENWDGCIAKAEQECVDPKPSAWTESEVHSVVTKKFKENGGPDVMAYINKRVFPGATMNEMLVYMGDEQAGGEDAAYEFLGQHEKLWSQWVTEEVALKVKAGLK